MTVDLYRICVRRDAHTSTPVTVPAYEIPVLQDIFGVENVHNADGRRVDEQGPGKVVGRFTPAEDEYTRFCSKYGAARIEQVFGKSRTSLDRLVGEAKAKTKAGTSSGSKADAKAGVKTDAGADAKAAKTGEAGGNGHAAE